MGGDPVIFLLSVRSFTERGYAANFEGSGYVKICRTSIESDIKPLDASDTDIGYWILDIGYRI